MMRWLCDWRQEIPLPRSMDTPPRLQGILMDCWQRPIPVDGASFLGMSASLDQMEARVESFCCCRSAIREQSGRLLRLPFGDKQRIYLPAKIL